MNVSINVCLGVGVSLQAEGQEVASVVSAQEIRVVGELLQVSPEGLQKSVTFKMTVSRKHNALTHTHTMNMMKRVKLQQLLLSNY